MIKNRLKTLMLGVVLSTTSLVAGEYTHGIKSLVGIEGGYNSVVSEVTDSSVAVGLPGNYAQNNTSAYHGGFKLGAESEDIRIFLSARTYSDTGDNYSSMYTYGGEIQYKFNVAKFMNLYLGANAGQAQLAYTDENTLSMKISEPYIGADVGVNIHAGDSVDLEFGARMMSIEASRTLATKEYRLNNITTAYASLIFKWTMQ